MIIKHKKKNYGDSLTTPRDIFLLCQKLFNLKCTIDVCATKKNRQCKYFISKKQNFLKRINFNKKSVLWCNFPHSEQEIFVEHLYYIWRKNKCSALLLLPINCLCNNYAKKFILKKASYKILTGRIKFLNPNTLKPSKEISVNGYVVVYFKRRMK